MRYELLDAQGAVTDVIVADAAFMAANYTESAYRLAEEQGTAAPAARRITKLAFRNRFTANEKAAMEIAAVHDHTLAKTHASNLLAAALRASMADQRDARYIDLERPDTRAGVQTLEAAGLLAPGRALEVLDTPVQSGEAFTGDV